MKRLRRLPLTASGWTVLALGVAAYVAGWQLGWVELMVVAAGCLIVLLAAIPFVVGRLTPRRASGSSTRNASRSATAPSPSSASATPAARRWPRARSRTMSVAVRCASTSPHSAPVEPPRRVPAAHDQTRDRHRRAGADRHERPRQPDAARGRPDRHANAVGPPPGRRPAPAPGRVRQGSRGPDVGHVAGRRRRLPRPARVRARRRPPAHPLDVDGRAPAR